MRYIKFTYVDAVTEVSIVREPAANGPKFPPIPSLAFVWARESAYPCAVPEFFGTVADDAAIAVEGVLAELSQVDFDNMQADEMRARDPVPQVVTPFQAKAALAQIGKLDDVEALMANDATPVLAKLAWQEAIEFRRTSPTLLALADELSMTDTELDAMFRAAAKIEA